MISSYQYLAQWFTAPLAVISECLPELVNIEVAKIAVFQSDTHFSGQPAVGLDTSPACGFLSLP